MNVFGEIYIISNTENGKKYIGLTTQGHRKRFAQHCKASSVIGQTIRKYGKDKFEIKVIDTGSSQKELAEKETYYINQYDTFNNGYNLTLGGEGVHLLEPLQVELNEKQERFIKYVNKENKKPIDVFNSAEMVKMVLINLIYSFLIADFAPEKKQVAKLINKLQPEYKKATFETQVINLQDVQKWTA